MAFLTLLACHIHLLAKAPDQAMKMLEIFPTIKLPDRCDTDQVLLLVLKLWYDSLASGNTEDASHATMVCLQTVNEYVDHSSDEICIKLSKLKVI